MSEEEVALVERARAWLIINVWGERPGAETWTPHAPPDVVLRGLTRWYPGGIDAFVAEHLEKVPPDATA